MKKFIVIALAFVLFSCVEDDPEPTNDISGKWKLISMSGNTPNSETTGQDMDWQENYELKPDETFVKTRVRDGQTTTATGNYSRLNLSDGEYIQLTFNEESDIIGTCIGELKEELFLNTKSSFSSTWLACDGPGLNYQKISNTP